MIYVTLAPVEIIAKTFPTAAYVFSAVITEKKGIFLTPVQTSYSSEIFDVLDIQTNMVLRELWLTVAAWYNFPARLAFRG
jgi:hypothetical protein